MVKMRVVAENVEVNAIAATLNFRSDNIYERNDQAGGYTNLKTGDPLARNIPEMLCLVHSEISEALEGFRKDLMDDHIPDRKMFEVELADTLIRIFDLAGYQGLDLGGALIEKLEYNASRADHKIENRRQPGGKSC
jgi:NTP pyrophosphatase (non-canonical NTP hydrolase)